MNSLSTIEQINIQQFFHVLQQVDPELYMIKVALHETQLNPRILLPIIRSLSNLSYGTGYGKIEVFMSKFIVTAVKGEESNQVNQQALVDQNQK